MHDLHLSTQHPDAITTALRGTDATITDTTALASRLSAEAQAHGLDLDPEDLHDHASAAASNANNGGLDAQITLLLNLGWTEQDIRTELKLPLPASTSTP